MFEYALASARSEDMSCDVYDRIRSGESMSGGLTITPTDELGTMYIYSYKRLMQARF